MIHRMLMRIAFFGLVVSAATPFCSAQIQGFSQTDIVSDQPGFANNTDGLLVNAWGLSRRVDSPWQVSNNASSSSTSTEYDGFGGFFGTVVNFPAPSFPTGNVPNPTTNEFLFSKTTGQTPLPALFLFATIDGGIAAWNPSIDPSNPVFVVKPNAATNSYTGITIQQVTPATSSAPAVYYIFAANFKTGTIDIYDGTFKKVNTSHASSAATAALQSMSTGTSAAALTARTAAKYTFAPYNVQAVGSDLVVTFAAHDSSDKVVTGAGVGIVGIFAPSGLLLNILQPGNFLNAPWGITQAPADFQQFSHALLIGNHGDGSISAFDAFSGLFLGQIPSVTGNPILIDGLYGIGFGSQGSVAPNSPVSGANNVLYFTAGPSQGTHGLFGSLTPTVPDFSLGEQ